MRALKEKGVESREDFIPFNDQTIFIEKGLTMPGECPVASEAGREGFYIPSGTDISEEEQAYVCEVMHEVAASFRA
jgi:perosamine synthetase